MALLLSSPVARQIYCQLHRLNYHNGCYSTYLLELSYFTL